MESNSILINIAGKSARIETPSLKTEQYVKSCKNIIYMNFSLKNSKRIHKRLITKQYMTIILSIQVEKKPKSEHPKHDGCYM